MQVTFDQDNDEWTSIHCSLHNYGSAWWYKGCDASNLNAKVYAKPGTTISSGRIPHWDGFHGEKYSLQFTEMKMRRDT